MSSKIEEELQRQQTVSKFINEMDTSAFTVHTMTVDEALKHYKADRTKGLTTTEANKRLEEYGSNELEGEPEKSIWERIAEQFEDELVIILLVAAVISFVIAITGDGQEGLTAYVEPFVILLILVLNAIVAIWQDSQSDNALEALKNMQAVACKTLRDGTWTQIDAKVLVPGDIIQLHAGDCVPADIRIVEISSIALQCGQAALTGESASVQKTIKVMGKEATILQDQKNMLFSSTIINQGTVTGVVAYTGMKTAIGTVSKEVQEASEEQEDTPLGKQLDNFGNQLWKLIAAICLLVWLMNFKKFSDPVHGTTLKGCIYYFKIAVALAVAAIPEGLPAVITTCLALGTRKMSANNCIVRRLPSVETLGCTSVICSDKTGTLTKNEMCAVKFAIVGNSLTELTSWDIEENSYSPEGKINGGFSEQTFKLSQSFKHLADVCALNNQSIIQFKNNAFKIIGEPTEAALKVFAEKLGKYSGNVGNKDQKINPMGYADTLAQNVKTVATLEFSSERKCMSTIVKGYEGNSGNTILLKGAPERVVAKCSNYLNCHNQKQPLSEADKQQLTAKIAQVSAQGYRVLGIAIGTDGGNMKQINEKNAQDLLSDTSQYDQLESGLSFIGYVCIQDPVRHECKAAIESCKHAGINVIMITGDSKETAVAIAKQLAIISDNADISKTCFTGTEFDKLNHAQKLNILRGKSGKVFSRVEPKHKREIVKYLTEMGEIVAMTGDGVNDAPALKQAHIGIAMGITGTEVAKQASDMVLADDNFATIVKAVEEGRAIYSNMKAFIRYMISSNVGEVLSIFLSTLLGLPEGFNSIQLLWVNLVTDGPPATALSFNPPDKDVMRKPPRKSDEALISEWTYVRFAVIGSYVGCATVGIFAFWYCMAESGDGHSLVTFQQLSHWTECPTWEGFKVNNFIEGMDLQTNPCDYFVKGKVKASTLSLSVLVVIEMLNCLNAISEDLSLMTMPPHVNPLLLVAIANSLALHAMIVYVPFFNEIFSIYKLNGYEWGLVFAFSFPVIIIDEVLKFFSRGNNERALAERLKQD